MRSAVNRVSHRLLWPNTSPYLHSYRERGINGDHPLWAPCRHLAISLKVVGQVPDSLLSSGTYRHEVNTRATSAAPNNTPLEQHNRYRLFVQLARITDDRGEPRRVCRRLIDVSYAAMASVSRAA